jgi:hypothetical protein
MSTGAKPVVPVGSGRPSQLIRLSMCCWQQPAGNNHVYGQAVKGQIATSL